MPTAEGKFQLPFNTPFREIERVLELCRRQPDGVSKPVVRRLLHVGDRTLQYKKYALFWTGWVAEENGKFILTDFGSHYLQGDQETKQRILWRQIKRYPPYYRPLKVAHDEARSRITQQFVQEIWRREFAREILRDVNRQKFDRAPKFFIEICRIAGLGTTIAEDGALALEIDRGRLKECIKLVQKVFIGHGHDRQALEKVTAFVERSCGLSAIVVQTLPDSGVLHILTKVQKHLHTSDYCVFLLTGDVLLESRDRQARLNVYIEVGMAIEKRKKKTCLLVEKGIVEASDLQGVLVKFFKKGHVEKVFHELRRGMRHAGLEC